MFIWYTWTSKLVFALLFLCQFLLSLTYIVGLKWWVCLLHGSLIMLLGFIVIIARKIILIIKCWLLVSFAREMLITRTLRVQRTRIKWSLLRLILLNIQFISHLWLPFYFCFWHISFQKVFRVNNLITTRIPNPMSVIRSIDNPGWSMILIS